MGVLKASARDNLFRKSWRVQGHKYVEVRVLPRTQDKPMVAPGRSGYGFVTLLTQLQSRILWQILAIINQYSTKARPTLALTKFKSLYYRN